MLIKYIASDGNTLTSLSAADTMQKIDAADLATGTNASSSNYSYSIWFYIDDWNYKYGERKAIFGRMTQDTDVKQPCPVVYLGREQNNLEIVSSVYPGDSTSGDQNAINTCSVANVPIQKWVNLIVSAYGRTMDVYLDGKLVRTCVLPGVSNVDSNASVYVTPNGGFSGWTSKFQYWPESCNPQKAWNIYKQGYGGSWLGNMFGKYTVKISLMEGDVEDNSIEF
tara:strand:+ start:4890 stop:5561 length:672 start_codon:yes stop_codon:yes gene_type:complete